MVKMPTFGASNWPNSFHVNYEWLQNPEVSHCVFPLRLPRSVSSRKERLFFLKILKIFFRDLRHLKTRNHSHVDIWVKPECFLRHNGPSRIHRVSKAKTMRLKVTHIRWLAKITYMPEERYGLPELMEISKTLVQEVPGLSCSWIHPRIESR